MHPVHAMFSLSPTLEKKKYSADVTEDAQAPNPWEAVLAHPLGQYPQNGGIVVISLSCLSHTKLIFRLPEEAHFPNLWGRCSSDQRRTRWPSERPALGMNNHSEKKRNQNNNKSAKRRKEPAS